MGLNLSVVGDEAYEAANYQNEKRSQNEDEFVGKADSSYLA